MHQRLAHDILNHLPVSYLLVDSNGNIIDCNNHLVQLLGYSKKELIDRSLYNCNLFAPQKLQQLLDECIEKGSTETRLDISGKRGELNADIKFQKYRIDDNTLVAITFQKSSIESVLQSQLELNNIIFLALIDNSHRALFIESPDGVILYLNKKLLTFLKISEKPDRLVGLKKEVLIDPIIQQALNPERFIEFVNNCLFSKIGVVDFDIELNQGQTFRLAYEPVFHEQELKAHIWFFNDITSETNAKREVIYQKEFYDQVIREMPFESIILKTENLELLHINELASRNQNLLQWKKGITLDAFVQRQGEGKHKSFLERKMSLFYECIESRNPIQYDDIIEDQDGNRHYFKRFITPYFNQNALYLISEFSVDLTDLKQAEEELVRVQNQLLSLIDTSQAMIWSVDTNLNLTYSNQYFKEITKSGLGFDLYDGELILKGAITPEQYAFWKSNYDLALSGETFTLPSTELDEDKIFDFTFKPIRNNQYEIIGVSVIAFNISALVKSNKLLERSEMNLQALVTSLDDVVFELNNDGYIINIWTSNNEIYSLPKEQFIGKKILEIENSARYQRLNQLIENSKRDLTTYYFDNTNNNRSYQSKISPIILDGVVNGVSILTKDITDKKQQEVRLQESETKFRLISEQMIDMVYVVNLEGKFTYLSPSTEQLIKYNPDELIGKSFYDLIADVDLPRVLMAIDSIHKDEPTAVIEMQVRRKDGSLIDTESKVKLVLEDLEKPIYQIVTRDISERKAAEESNQNALAKEKELITMKSRLVSTVSHEFKTPMSTIRSSAELIEMYLEQGLSKNRSKIKPHISIITDEIDRINKLINNVLLLMKEDSKMAGPNAASIDLVKLCEKVVATNFARSSESSQLHLESLAKESIVFADPIQITYVLFNLINNALKYSNGSDVKLIIASDDQDITIKIIDEGIGIPEKDMPYLFTSFYRGSNTDEFPGTGLGLVIVKTFIEKNGGQVSLESKLHCGTTATIKLPLYQ